MTERRKREYVLRMVKRPGKFEGEPEITEYLYHRWLEGCHDEMVGDVSFFYSGRYPLVGNRGVYGEDGEKRLTQDECEYLKSLVGASIYIDDNGFVTGTYYETEEEMEKAKKGAESSSVDDEPEDSFDNEEEEDA